MKINGHNLGLAVIMSLMLVDMKRDIEFIIGLMICLLNWWIAFDNKKENKK